jgi:hypothetical protein
MMIKLFKGKIPQFHDLAILIPFRQFRAKPHLRVTAPHPDILHIVHHNIRQLTLLRGAVTVVERTGAGDEEYGKGDKELPELHFF